MENIERIGYPLVIVAAIVAIWVWLRRPGEQTIIEAATNPNYLGAGVAPIAAYIASVPDYLVYNVAGVGLHTRAAMMATPATPDSAGGGCGCHKQRTTCGDPSRQLGEAYAYTAPTVHPVPA